MSTADLGKHVHAMLNSTQLSSSTIRRWLKPVSHTGDPKNSIGAPWEINRYPGFGKSHVIDLYRKNGQVNQYGSIYGLVPEFSFGYTATTLFNGVARALQLETILVSTLLQALFEISREQAVHDFTGTYVGAGINSSLTIGADADIGLIVQSWVSNGTDMLSSASLFQQLGYRSPRIYSTGIKTKRKAAQGGWRVAFRVAWQAARGACASWGTVDGLRYGTEPLDEFVFDTNPDGVALSVMNPGLRVTMTKQLVAPGLRVNWEDS
jgi:hypothetical protein